jgi:formiminotetrahydrofolate cyclodeaminase
MVAGLSRKKKSQAAPVDKLSEAVADFQAAARALAEAIDRDAASFESVMAAYKMPQGSAQEQGYRETAIQQALEGAAQVPLEVARKSADIFERLGQLESISSPSMLSDVRVGRLMAAVAVRGAIENVSINLESIKDSSFNTRMQTESAALLARVSESPVNANRS